MGQTIEDFAHALLGLKKNETEKAVAYMWYEKYQGFLGSFLLSEIVSELKRVGLFVKPVNKDRLGKNLKKHRLVTYERISQQYTLSEISMRQLSEEYEKLLLVKSVKVRGDFIDPLLFDGTRDYFPKLVLEINGCYEYGFFDGAAVLLRRIVESLLIEIFIHQKHESIIKKPDNSYSMLDELIGLTKSGHYIRISRGMDKILDSIKELGDTASHHRYHLSTNNDFDWLKSRIGKLLSELVAKSGLK